MNNMRKIFSVYAWFHLIPKCQFWLRHYIHNILELKLKPQYLATKSFFKLQDTFTIIILLFNTHCFPI